MKLQITESPRDAMQGLHDYIPAQLKADYINCLLNVGFDIIDMGSFVSEKAIPQLKDTAEVLGKLNLSDTISEIMVLVANEKGIETATSFDEVSWLAFPFSASPSFLKLNINADNQKALKLIELANKRCLQNNNKLKVYITMAFGNPYGDVYNDTILFGNVYKLYSMGVRFITLSDNTGVATPQQISNIYTFLIRALPDIEFGIHLHTTSNTYYEKLEAAYSSGCRSFDAVINGMGGCPMTGYELLSNLNTLDLIDFSHKNNIKTNINNDALGEAVKMNIKLFQSPAKTSLINSN